MAKCDNVMKGYLNLPEETSAFFGKDGFVHTGDLARYDEDGVLYYEGRLKELVSDSLYIFFLVNRPKSIAISNFNIHCALFCFRGPEISFGKFG